MKGIAARLVIVIAFVGGSFVCARAGTSRTFSDTDVVGKASGVGSRAAVVLRDGTVCTIDAIDPSQCSALGTLPAPVVKIIHDNGGKFDGVFDLLGDDVPQVFVDYSPRYNDPNCLPPYNKTPNWTSGPAADCDAMALLVYRNSGNGYQRYLTLNAPTEGYGPGAAWFLDEYERKAIFETRCGGSSGSCFFYLDLHKRALELISDDYFLEGEPIFEDIDHDGNAEIFIPARGRDRTATQGAVLLRWTGSTYRVWWPQWKPPPYVIYAQTAYAGHDHIKEIVAILDSGADAENGSPARTLGVWRLSAGKWRLVAKTALPPAETMTTPTLDGIISDPHGARILLTIDDSGKSFVCRYSDRKITCPPSPGAAK